MISSLYAKNSANSFAGASSPYNPAWDDCQDVFFTDDDREMYLSILKEPSEKFGFWIHAYCLMTNHIHLVAVPGDKESLGKTMGRVNLIYTQYINRLHHRSGHLWQNRYYSCGMDEESLLAAIIYVERNPVRAGIKKRGWLYNWSSALAHVKGEDATGILEMPRWKKMNHNTDWRKVLEMEEDKNFIEKLRLCRNRGRPMVSDSILSKLESSLGRRLRPLPVGRPKKKEIAPSPKGKRGAVEKVGR
jgi:putative transposase